MTCHRLPGITLWCAVLGVLLTTSVPVTDAQSLGDVARREAERRKQVTPGKVYTDGDVPAGESAVAPGSPALSEAPASDGTSGETHVTVPPSTHPGIEPTIVKGKEKRDEQHWRGQASDVRERLAKATREVQAREARMAEIDRSPQTPTLIRERETLAASLTRLQRDVRSLNEELTRFLTRAQMANVPDEWIR